MSDFFQSGPITTLHRLGPAGTERMEAELGFQGRAHPVSLVLPCLHTEIRGPALSGIVGALSQVKYLHEVIVSVSGTTDPREFAEVRRFFAPVRNARCIWGSGPRVAEMLSRLRESGLDAGPDGKGRAVWIGIGCALAEGECQALAFHDCDILTYDREFLARLCLPIAHPNLGYDYVKGYYGRVTDRLHGRVTRLLVTPLVRSLKRTLGHLPLLEFIDAFRYPLAGEFAMTSALARQVRIPSDWGLEVGLLAEVFRNTSLQRVCQVELADNYDHRHQELSPGDPQRGLNRMVIDIARSLYHDLASVGVQFDAGFLNTLCASYVRQAQESLRAYSDVALVNGLHFDPHDEERMVETFAAGLRIAGLEFVRDPLPQRQIPNWHRVIAAHPESLKELRDSLSADGR